MCGDKGDRLWEFKLWWCQSLSSSFNSKEGKALLDGGDIVVRLLSSYDDEASGGSADESRTEVDRWMHISLIYFNPYKTWLREVTWPDMAMNEHGHLLLQATDTHWTMMQMLSDVYLDWSEWAMRFYRLIDDDHPIATVDGRAIRVQHMVPDTAVAPHAARMPRAPKPRDDPLLKALDDVGVIDKGSGAGSDDDVSSSGEGDGQTSAEERSPRGPKSKPSTPRHRSPNSEGGSNGSEHSVDLFFTDSEESKKDNSGSSDSSSSDDGTSGKDATDRNGRVAQRLFKIHVLF